MTLLKYLLIALVLGLGIAPVQAEEVIHAFNSRIDINADASLTVTETITVEAEGVQIKRGIYRDFPTRYKDHYGNHYIVEFNVLQVLRDGEPEPWHLENRSNGVRVYIGNKNKRIRPGRYTYSIQYYTSRQLGFFQEYDELYWNVTGNGWNFPILSASALVQLPPGVSMEQTRSDAFTGRTGSTEKNFSVSITEDNLLLFEATQVLNPGEGLTIVVDWPKGYVTEPSAEQKRQWFLNDNKTLLIGLSGLGILWLYFIIVWRRVGKDPQKGVIYPRYQPPPQHSPASIRFVTRMAYDNKTFAAALVNMAVKGYININDSNSKKFIINKVSKSRHSEQTPPLSRGEAVIMRELFSGSDSITLTKSKHRIIGKSIESHKKILKRDYEQKYFKTNMLYSLPGLLISIITLVTALYAIEPGQARDTSFFMVFWLSIWSLGTLALVYRAYSQWKSSSSSLDIISALFMTLFAAPFLAAELFVLYKLWETAGTGIVLTFIMIILTHFLFYQWMKAPTLLGRKLLDKVEGFKLYLSVAEQQELKFKNSPRKTPELFERYLPYAIALGVETQWSKRFNKVFEKLQQNGQQHSPHWYHGRHWNTANLAGFSSAMGDSLGSAIASSSTAPGSASGSSGGSSGGGGGGGGGGGW